MSFFSREIQQPNADLLKMMTAIGSQIGQFIKRKQAEEELQQPE
jgi:GAF domain-containing protein